MSIATRLEALRQGSWSSATFTLSLSCCGKNLLKHSRILIVIRTRIEWFVAVETSRPSKNLTKIRLKRSYPGRQTNKGIKHNLISGGNNNSCRSNVHWRGSVVADKIVGVTHERTRQLRTEVIGASDLTTGRPHHLDTRIQQLRLDGRLSELLGSARKPKNLCVSCVCNSYVRTRKDSNSYTQTIARTTAG